MEQTKPPVAPATGTARPRTSGRLIEHVSVALEAYLGDARMSVAEMSDLAKGSVVALDAPLNQPIDLRLNGVSVARGELVAVGDKFAVRLTEVAQWPD
jgi:flagellar motor switch protein FliN/FliY